MKAVDFISSVYIWLCCRGLVMGGSQWAQGTLRWALLVPHLPPAGLVLGASGDEATARNLNTWGEGTTLWSTELAPPGEGWGILTGSAGHLVLPNSVLPLTEKAKVWSGHMCKYPAPCQGMEGPCLVAAGLLTRSRGVWHCWDLFEPDVICI